MSAVTLETLRADFEAACWTLTSMRPRPHGPHGIFALLDEHTENVDALACITTCLSGERERDANGPNDHGDATPVVRAARMYVIARDYGLDAAMLYKLSDGAIDPRRA